MAYTETVEQGSIASTFNIEDEDFEVTDATLTNDAVVLETDSDTTDPRRYISLEDAKDALGVDQKDTFSEITLTAEEMTIQVLEGEVTGADPTR